MSHVTKAVCEAHHDIQHPQYVYVTLVSNEETRNLVDQHLFTAENDLD